MRNVFLFLALLSATGCGGGGGAGGGSAGLFNDWSHAGLSFDGDTRTFSGIPKTTALQMPTFGTANYTGEYRASSSSSSGQGNATLDVNFGLFASVGLTLTGWVDASGTGLINHTGFLGAVPGLSFLGEFYGSDASVAAGEFTSGGIVGHFIVN